MNIDAVKRDIKHWEHSFTKSKGRPPGKSDVKKHSQINQLYKIYKSLKRGNSDHIDIIPGLSDEEDDGKEESPGNSVLLAPELGPTPQAQGKVLSIFDMKVTPPQSSPLKTKDNKPEMPEMSEFKTPTKLPKPTISTPKGSSLMDKLKSAGSPIKTPAKTPVPVNETPQYLKVNLQRYNYEKPQHSPFVTSPIKKDGTKSTPITTPTKTPTKSTPIEQFQTSPSPLKPQRVLNRHKSLIDVFNDHKNLTLHPEEDIDQGSDHKQDSEEEQVSALPSKRRKPTQKRSTRRWKIKPREYDVHDSIQGKDVHQEIAKQNDSRQQHMQKYLDGEEEELEPEPEPELPTSKVQSSGRKVAPISNNYRRLKINKGNKRWKRR